MYNFEIKTVLVALIGDFRYSDAEKINILGKLNKGVFEDSGSPAILPIPDQVDSSIPRMMLSKVGEYEVSISRNRIDFKWFKFDADDNLATLQPRIENFLECIFSPEFVPWFQSIKRAGVYIQSHSDTFPGNTPNRAFDNVLKDPNPLLKISDRNDSSKLTYRMVNLDTTIVPDLVLNNISHLSTDVQGGGIDLSVDINNMDKPEFEFNKLVVLELWENLNRKFDSIKVEICHD